VSLTEKNIGHQLEMKEGSDAEKIVDTKGKKGLGEKLSLEGYCYRSLTERLWGKNSVRLGE